MTAFFSSILSGIDSFVGNYGVAVILFTLFIRVVLLPLDFKSRKSMRAMTKLQPKMQELQKKYAKDKDKLNMKMQKLYKQEKINPLAGCLPMLIQLPVLWIMWSAMRNIADTQTAEMLKGLFDSLIQNGYEGVGKVATDSFLWIRNIFQPDSFSSMILPSYDSALNIVTKTFKDFAAPEGFQDVYNNYAALNYGLGQFQTIKVLFWNISLPNSFSVIWDYANGLFILPIGAAVSQFITTKVTGGSQPKQPVNPNDQSPANAMNSGFMKWFFPLFSLYICASYNSAFSLYWCASNLIMLLQTVIINKVLDRQDAIKAQNQPNEIDIDDL